MTTEVKYSTGQKALAYFILVITLGIVTQGAISLPPKYEAGSLKDKVIRVTTILWAIIFFCIGTIVVVAMFDSFFVNRAILVKYLTRTFLFLLVSILITDGVVGLIKNSDKTVK